MKNNTKPFLRWAGSKKQILPAIEPFGQGAKRYIEPFVGSACLFFRLRPNRAVLGDINDELISTYRTVRLDPTAVYDSYSRFRNTERHYKEIRNLIPTDLSRVDRAARFIYLNRFCFNGLYRTNLKGEFNVPYGGLKSGELPSLSHLTACSRLLKRARLRNGSFEQTLKLAKRGDFVYMDPPFSVAARRVFKEYNSAIFSDKDVKRLRMWMEKLAAKKIKFLVSYAESDEAEYLSKGFISTKVVVRRHIAGAFSNRVHSAEVLINFDPRRATNA